MFAVFVAILLVQAVVAYHETHHSASECDIDELPSTLDMSMTCSARSGREDKDFAKLLKFCDVLTNKQECRGTCNACHVRSHHFQHDILSSQNSKRGLNQAEALEWDMDLETSADAHCQHLVAKDKQTWVPLVSDEFTFPTRTGRNVYVGVNIRNLHNLGKRAVNLWYATNVYYDFEAGKFSVDSRSFTQLVWKSTMSVGCSYATGLKEGADGEPIDNMVYVCCHYKSVGNVRGRFLKNVMKPEK